jgi:hypothetical protein
MWVVGSDFFSFPSYHRFASVTPPTWYLLDDPQRIEDWLLNTLDGAIFEFAFDPNLELTSNGVSLQPATLPQKNPPAQPNQND